jgi:2-keto-3-deoxy-L-rhamnonate aldolase RhmA
MKNDPTTQTRNDVWPATSPAPGIAHWLKASLARGEAVLGIMVSEIRTPMLGALLDAAGMHFAIIDQEHGAFGPESLAALIAGFRGGVCRPFVRIAETRREYILTALELGASGIVVPRVESRAQAEEIVRYARYAPAGDRGLSLCRAHTGFRRVEQREYIARANAEILVIAQIETKRALENLDEILGTPGIDMVFIGPSDLSLSCGISSSLRAPEMRAAVDHVIARARHFGVGVGIQTYDPDAAAELVAAGVGLVSCNTDVNALLSGLASIADPLRRKAARNATPEGAA